MHESHFPVRIFDVDAFGQLRTPVLLRFLWQTASDASTAVGYDLEWYERAGTLWIIRRTRLELAAPLRYRDELSIRTWVSDIRRVRSQRQYEVRRAGDAAPVGRAVTDWVYVDLARGALIQPPAEMQAALMPDGVVAEPRRPSLAAPAPAGAWQGTRRVELGDLDTVAHVNNAQYALFVEQATWDALAAHGWSVDPTGAAGHLQLAATDLEYFDSAQYGDQLSAAVWVSAVNDTAFTADCQLLRAGSRSLHARCTWRWSAGALPDALRGAVGRLLSV